MKSCSKCKIIKETKLFSSNKSRKDGLSSLCKACDSQKCSVYYEKHREEKLEYFSKYRKNNIQKEVLRVSKWSKENPAKRNAKEAKRRAKKFRGTPSWLTKEMQEEISKIYLEASMLTKNTGVSYEVDHISPLQGKNVSGLHVPWNLQILPASMNRSKGNR